MLHLASFAGNRACEEGMYEAFYGFTEKPFNLTPDPRFLFLSEKHREAFAHLLFGIKSRSGFVMVTGEIGTGKTTICRTLLNQLDENTEVAFIFNPSLSPEELLRKINEEFGIASRASSTKGLIDELNAYLLDRAAGGKNCVLVIDEAQNLEPAVLEQIRLLSNLETETQKLLQIVLVGQPELAQHLALPELRQLDQRISARYHLQQLDLDETLQYIAFRLRVAGGRRKVQFTRGALKAIYRYSKGTPRVINAVCDRSLLIGYTREDREISAGVVAQAAREIRGVRTVAPAQSTPKKGSRLCRVLPTPALVLALVALVLVGKYVVLPLYQSQGGWMNLFVPFDKPSDAVAANPKDVANAAVTEHNPGGPLSGQVASTPATEPEWTLVDVLDQLDPAVGRNAGSQAILRAWSMALLGDFPATDAEEDLVTFLRANNLKAERLTLTPSQLAALNLPALVRLASSRSPMWAALTSIVEDGYVISTGLGKTEHASLEEFEAVYLGRAIVAWRDTAPDTPVLRPDMTGPSVHGLQARLRDLGLLDREPTGLFDQATREAIEALQRETGIKADGVVGPQTRMVLASWSDDIPTPALETREAPASHIASTAQVEGPVEQPVDQPEAAPPSQAPAEEHQEGTGPTSESEAASAVQAAQAPEKPAAGEGPVTPVNQSEDVSEGGTTEEVQAAPIQEPEPVLGEDAGADSGMETVESPGTEETMDGYPPAADEPGTAEAAENDVSEGEQENSADERDSDAAIDSDAEPGPVLPDGVQNDGAEEPPNDVDPASASASVPSQAPGNEDGRVRVDELPPPSAANGTKEEDAAASVSRRLVTEPSVAGLPLVPSIESPVRVPEGAS
jgi:general secretion pathway protein A